MLSQSRRGFTLVEILMVVLILAICAAVIIPQLGTRDDLKAAAGARVIMSDLIWAQNRAIATQQKQYVVFSGDGYTLKYRNSSGTIVTSTHPVQLGAYTTIFGGGNTPLADVSLGTHTFASQASVCFDEMGTPYGWNGSTETSMTGAGTIGVTCGNQALTISIEPYTGEASVN